MTPSRAGRAWTAITSLALLTRAMNRDAKEHELSLAQAKASKLFDAFDRSSKLP